MEDQVPFKVFVNWTEKSKPEVRRFGVDKTVVTSFHYLNAKLQDVYPGLKGKTYKVTWKDEDEDDITISSDEEMMTCLTALHGNLVKLYVHVADSNDKDDECDPPVVEIHMNSDPIDVTHYSVTCDSCNSQVVGFRYKCTICFDYDLCSKCESAGLHPEHCMVRLPSPVMPRNLIKAAIKRSRHFLKTVASAPDANKRHRRDKSNERRREHPHGSRHHYDEKRFCRPRTSWLETFTTYMNEFANLAGDVGIEKPTQQDTTEGEKKSEEQPKVSAENPQAPSQPQPDVNSNINPQQIPVLPGMENISKFIEMFLNGTLASHLQNADSNAYPAPAKGGNDNSQSGQASTSSGSQPGPSTTTDDVEMSDNFQKNPEVLNVTVKTEPTPVASGDTAGRDVSPDKADGWTLINKEREFPETSDNANATGEVAAGPIGFNLPEEFQERVRINEGHTLYPPLNFATAEPTPPTPPRSAPIPPKAPTAPQAPTSPQAPTAPQVPSPPRPEPQPRPQQRPQPQPHHPLAHIEAAIQQMLTMGFTNEGGWLTKLLESKDGNIAAVLDLLTPPKH